MQQKNELIVGALGDMLRSLILAFPFGSNIPHVFKLAMILIEANLMEKEDSAIYKLYHFMSMEYHENLNLFSEMR